MNRIRLLWILTASAIVGLAIWFVAFDDLDRAALAHYTGQKSSGTFAGVSVGDPEDVAVQAFESRRMVSAPYADDGSCPLSGTFDHVLVFVDVSWRKGTICVGISEGVVKSMAWRYNFMQP